MSHARVHSLETQLEALVQSEGRLKEQVSSLEEEKQHLVSTVTRLQDLLTMLGLNSTLDEHTLPTLTNRQTASAETKTNNSVDTPQ